jgi:hypothetical protein
VKGTPSVQLRLGLPFLLPPCGVHNNTIERERLPKQVKITFLIDNFTRSVEK